MLRLKNASTAVFMVVTMLPACSLVIDTKPDGVLDATAGKGATKVDSSRTAQGGATSSSNATRLSSGGGTSTTAGGTIASGGMQNGSDNVGGDASTATGVGAAPADTTPTSSSGSTAPMGVGGAATGGDGGTGGLAASGGVTAAGAAMPTGGAVNSSLGGSGGINTTSQQPAETCSGCSIGSACIAVGAVNPQNVCETCDPVQDAQGWSPVDGEVCDDGNYCTTQSRCEAGECVPSQQRSCGSNQHCDESSNACVCDGCQIGTSCVAAGTVDPSNPCRICSLAASRSAYSPNTGANCGSGPTECSGQDTCSASGTCQPNHSPNDSTCTGGTCQDGACQINPFDCVVPSPPEVVFPSNVLIMSGSAPTTTGGRVQDGRYVPTRIEIYGGNPSTVEVRTFEFRASYVQVGQRPMMVGTGGAVIPEIQFAGTFEVSGSSLSFTLERCTGYNLDVPTLSFTVSANGLTVQETLSGGVTVRTVLARQ